jgi:RNA-directed DNA polymerase
MPIPEMIHQINLYLRGWGEYLRHGYPRDSFRELSRFVLLRLTRHLQRRMQRPYRPPEGESFYAHLQRLGLQPL